MRMFGQYISSSFFYVFWRSLSPLERGIVVGIGILVVLLPVLLFSPIKSKKHIFDTTQRSDVSLVPKENLRQKGKALKFIANDAYFISSSSGSIADDQMTVEAVVCIPNDDPGQYNLISLIGDTQDIFTSSYTMKMNGTIDTSYAMLLNDNSYLTATASISSNTCHHLAVTAEAQNGVCQMHVFTDGNEAVSTDKADNCHLSTTPYKQFIIGSTVHGFKSFHGIIDEVRISDIVRYTTSFTPSSHPFAADEHTQHLYHLDGDTTDAAAGSNPSGETKGTEFTDTTTNSFPSPTGSMPDNLVSDPTNPPSGVIPGVPTPSIGLQRPSPTIFGFPYLSPTKIPSVITIASPTSLPGGFPSGDSDGYSLPGPAPTSFNQAAKFTYRNQSYISIDDSRMEITGSFTVEAWVRPIAEPPGLYVPAVIISKASPQKPYGMPFSLQLGLYLDNVIPYFSVDANNTRYTLQATNGFLTYNQWHHIAATVNTTNGTIRVFADGLLAGELVIGKRLVMEDPKIAMTIGALCLDENGTGQCSRHNLYFNGEIEEVRISKIVRYTTTFAPPTSPITADYNTLALYRLDGNAQDASGRNNHGNIHGSIDFPQSTVGVNEEIIPTPTEGL